MYPQGPQVVPPDPQHMNGLDDSAQEPPRIRDVKLNGDGADEQFRGTPPGYIEAKPHFDSGAEANDSHRTLDSDGADGLRASDGIDADAPILDIGGGHHGKVRVVDGSGHERKPDVITEDKHDDSFADDWDAELKGEPKPAPDHDTQVREELGEEAVKANGVQEDGHTDNQPTDDELDIHHDDNDVDTGFPATDNDVSGQPETVLSPADDELTYGDIVYNQVHEYADKHGISLSDGDARDVVDAVLAQRGIDWKHAEDLPVGQDAELDAALFDQYRTAA